MFEFDSAKSEANRTKHGIDFVRAQQLWSDPRLVRLEAKSDSEPRKAIIAKTEGRLWFAVYTVRGCQIRIISVRRARKRESEFYETEKE